MRVDSGWFFVSPERFPWGIFGIDYPGAGPLVAYLCRSAQSFAPPGERKYLNAQSIRDIERALKVEENLPTLVNIYTFMVAVGEPETTRGKATMVIEWLRNQSGFRKIFQKELDELYKKGVISIKEAIIL